MYDIVENREFKNDKHHCHRTSLLKERKKDIVSNWSRSSIERKATVITVNNFKLYPYSSLINAFWNRRKKKLQDLLNQIEFWKLLTLQIIHHLIVRRTTTPPSHRQNWLEMFMYGKCFFALSNLISRHDGLQRTNTTSYIYYTNYLQELSFRQYIPLLIKRFQSQCGDRVRGELPRFYISFCLRF